MQIHGDQLVGGLEAPEGLYFSTDYNILTPLVNAQQANYLDSIAGTLLSLDRASQTTSVPVKCIDRDGDIETPRKTARSDSSGMLIKQQDCASFYVHSPEVLVFTHI